MLTFSKEIIDQYPGYFACTNTDNVMIYCNPTTNAVLGYKTPDGYQGKTMEEMPCKAADFAEVFINQNNLIMQQNRTLKLIDIHPCVDDTIVTSLSTRYPLKINNVIKGIITTGDKITRKQLLNLSMAISRSDKKYREQANLTQRSYEIGNTFKNTKLSKRELECMFYIIRGKTLPEISTYLKLSKRTIEFYVENIKFKLNCTSKAELIELALETHFLDFIPDSLFEENTQMSVIIESF